MKRVYVAGAYSADNVLDVLHNIGRVIEESADLLSAGYAPFCPWLDYQFAMCNRLIPKQSFYEYSIAWLKVSQVVYVLGGWEKSIGTKKEIQLAEKLNIPVAYDLEELDEIAEDLK